MTILNQTDEGGKPEASKERRMNLNTIAEVKRPTSADQITHWRDGYAWLAGGTWLFSEPQISTDTLIDLERFRPRSFQINAERCVDAKLTSLTADVAPSGAISL